jgi:hypothetical protein
MLMPACSTAALLRRMRSTSFLFFDVVLYLFQICEPLVGVQPEWLESAGAHEVSVPVGEFVVHQCTAVPSL